MNIQFERKKETSKKEFAKKRRISKPIERDKKEKFKEYKKRIGRNYGIFLKYLKFEEEGEDKYIKKMSKIASALACNSSEFLTNQEEIKIYEIAERMKKIKLINPNKKDEEGIEEANATVDQILSEFEKNEKEGRRILKDALTSLAISFVVKMDETLGSSGKTIEEKEIWIKAAKRYSLLLHETGLRKSAQFVGFSLVKYLPKGKELAEWWIKKYGKLRKIKRSIKQELNKVFLVYDKKPVIFGRIKDPYSMYNKIISERPGGLKGLSFKDEKGFMPKISDHVDDMVGISIVLNNEESIMQTLKAVLYLFRINKYLIKQVNDYYHLGYNRKKYTNKMWKEEELIKAMKSILEEVFDTNLKEKIIKRKEKHRTIELLFRRNGNTIVKGKIAKRESGYRAIHIKIEVEGIPVEIQITKERFYHSKEFGRATHTKYKEDESKDKDLKGMVEKESIEEKLRRAFKISIKSFREKKIKVKLETNEGKKVLEINTIFYVGDIRMDEIKSAIVNSYNAQKKMIVEINRDLLRELNQVFLKKVEQGKGNEVVLKVKEINNTETKKILEVVDLEIK